MLVAERYEKIVEIVNERSSIRVTELSELCGVTEETIRRDLDRLEAAGRLRRSHGGAVSVKDGQQVETPFAEREIQQAEEKRQIAQQAVGMIMPGSRIILDASSTAWYMARILPDMPLTVLTNAIRVVTELSSKDKVEVISTGGRLAPRSMSFVGPLAEQSLQDYHVDIAFISAKGVHLRRGISESNDLQARVKRSMLRMAEQTVLLADSSKFGQQAFARVADLSEIRSVITDGQAPADMLDALREAGTQVTIV